MWRRRRKLLKQRHLAKRRTSEEGMANATALLPLSPPLILNLYDTCIAIVAVLFACTSEMLEDSRLRLDQGRASSPSPSKPLPLVIPRLLD